MIIILGRKFYFYCIKWFFLYNNVYNDNYISKKGFICINSLKIDIILILIVLEKLV